MVSPVDFSDYLRSLVEAYEAQPDCYTLTDLQVEVVVEPPSRSEQPFVEREQPAEREKKVERSSVLAGLRKYVQQGHVLLVGKPGSGKSTALQRLLWEEAQAALADPGLPIPVLVALRGDRSIPEAICAEFRRARLRVSADQIDQWLFDRRLLLLLDGVNEIPSEPREQEVRQFRSDNPQTPMIFTSRELGTGLGIEHKLEMCALTEPQMREFVGRYLRDSADALLRQLKDRLREVAETPLLLKFLCEVYDDPDLRETVGDLQNKGELFRAVDRKYNAWKTGEGIRTAEKFWQWNGELLRYLAFRMLQADGSPTNKWLAITRDEAEHLLEDFLGDRVTAPGERAKDWLQDLLEHHLLQLATHPNQIEFRHQLIQEYYAAEYLHLLLKEDKLSDTQLQCHYLNLLKWTEPLAMVAALVSKQEQAERIVRLALQMDWKLGARLAGEVKREFQEQTVGLVSELEVPLWLKLELWGRTRSEKAVSGLVGILKSSTSSLRESAVQVLGQIEGTQVTSALLNAISDKDSNVRWAVVAALAKVGDESAIPKLSEALNDKAYFVRLAAVSSLRRFWGDQAGKTALQKALQHLDWDVRLNAAYEIAKLGDSTGITILLQAVESHDLHISKRAILTLRSVNNDLSMAGLVTIINCSNPRLQILAAKALESVKSESIVEGLKKILRNDGSSVRLAAIEALGCLGSESAILILLQNLDEIIHRREQNLFIGNKIIEVLGKNKCRAAIPYLTLALKNQKAEIREAAARALGQIGDNQIVPVLLEALEDKDSDVRKSVVIAIGEIRSESALPKLLDALEDEDFGVQLSTIKSLEKIGSKTTIYKLSKMAESHNPSIALNAAATITQLGSQFGYSALFKALESENLDECDQLIPILENLNSESAIQFLEKALLHQAYPIYIRAVIALGKINSDSVISVLSKALEHGDPDVSWNAAIALARRSSDEAIPILITALGDVENSINRISAIGALGDLGSKKAILGLLKSLEDKDSEVRRSAAEALGKVKNAGAAPILPDLLRFIPTDSGEDALRALTAIQANCQFYNYEIFCSAPKPEPATSGQPTTNNFYGSVGIVNTDRTIIHGNQTGIHSPDNQLRD